MSPTFKIAVILSSFLFSSCLSCMSRVRSDTHYLPADIPLCLCAVLESCSRQVVAVDVACFAIQLPHTSHPRSSRQAVDSNPLRRAL